MHKIFATGQIVYSVQAINRSTFISKISLQISFKCTQSVELTRLWASDLTSIFWQDVTLNLNLNPHWTTHCGNGLTADRKTKVTIFLYPGIIWINVLWETEMLKSILVVIYHTRNAWIMIKEIAIRFFIQVLIMKVNQKWLYKHQMQLINPSVQLIY